MVMWRIVKHMAYMPWRSSNVFCAATRSRLMAGVRAAEVGHNAEIKVVIEGALSPVQAYRYSNWGYACKLFAELNVWDTEYNTGLLLYINMCDQSVDIVADRGIIKYVDNSVWQEFCEQMAVVIAEQGFVEGLEQSLLQMGALLRHKLPKVDKLNNQLSDTLEVRY